MIFAFFKNGITKNSFRNLSFFQYLSIMRFFENDFEFIKHIYPDKPGEEISFQSLRKPPPI